MPVDKDRKLGLLREQLDNMGRELRGMCLSEAERDDLIRHARGFMDSAEVAACFSSLKEGNPARSSITRQYCLMQAADLIFKYTGASLADERHIRAAEMWFKIATLLPEAN